MVGVNSQGEVVPRSAAGLAKPHGILLGAETTNLELHPSELSLDEAAHFGRDVGVLCVVPADRDHGHAVAVAPPQFPQGHAEGSSHRIPQRNVNAGGRHEPQASIPEDVPRRWSGKFPAPLDREGILADELGSDLLVDDAIDLTEARILVTRIRFTHDAAGRIDPRNDRGPMRHLVVAALVHAVEGNPHGDCLDPLDTQIGHRLG